MYVKFYLVFYNLHYLLYVFYTKTKKPDKNILCFKPKNKKLK